jgi:hypothetical protein
VEVVKRSKVHDKDTYIRRISQEKKNGNSKTEKVFG